MLPSDDTSTPTPLTATSAKSPLMAAAFAQLAEGVIVTDAAGRITFVNEAAAHLHGVARLDVPPEQYAETYHLLTEDGRPYPSAELPLARAVLRGETVLEARWRIRRPDGSEIFAVGSARPVRDSVGEQLGAVLTLRDDGPRVDAARAEQHAARILEQVSDAYFALDADFRIVAVNAAMERGSGLSRDALLGRVFWEIFPASVGTQYERHYRAAVTEGTPAHFTDAYDDGRLALVTEVAAYPAPGGGVAVFWRDITARVQAEAALTASEEWLRLAVAATGLGVYDWDLPTDVVTVNARFRELFGLPAGDAVIGAAMLGGVVHPEDLPFVDAKLAQAFDPRSSGSYRFEHRALTPAGEIWLLTFGQVFFAGEGDARRAVRVIGNDLDVTERKLAEAEREQALHLLQSQAVELEMQSEELNATAAHLEERTEAAEAAAAALRRGEQRYELAARATRNAIWDWDLTTDALAWNPGVADVFGYRPEDVADTIQWWYDHIHPDDRDRVVTGIHAVIDDPLGGADWEDEYRFGRGDGTYAHVYDRGTVARAGDGRAVRMIGAMLDVTREREALAAAEAGRRAAEATTRRAAFAGAVGVAITGGGTLDDMLQRCCQAAVDHLDAAFTRAWVLNVGEPVLRLRASAGLYTHLDGAHGRVPVGQLKIGQIAAERRPHLTNAVIGDPRVPEQAWARREGMVAFAGYPLVVGEELVGVFALFARQPLDEATFEALATAATGLSVAVTNARLLEAERRAREAAEAANQSKSEFLANMSHELRTPLNAIGGYADLLALGIRGPVTEAQRQDLDRLRRANQHMAGLVDSVLAFAQVEAGRVDYHLEAVDLELLAQDLEALVGPQLAAKGLAYDHEGRRPATPDRPHVVWADPEKVRQILINLLTNATKATDAPGRVALLCETDLVAGVTRVRVTDTGRGIPADQLERVFEPFVQLDRQRTQASQQGVGLGLAISRDLARGMGGDLTVKSEVGVGSTFTLMLPRA